MNLKGRVQLERALPLRVWTLFQLWPMIKKI